jgi:hypothetical protein
MFRRRNRHSQDSKASLNDVDPKLVAMSHTLQPTVNSSNGYKPDISMRRRPLPLQSDASRPHTQNRGRSASEPPQPNQVSQRKLLQ